MAGSCRVGRSVRRRAGGGAGWFGRACRSQGRRSSSRPAGLSSTGRSAPRTPWGFSEVSGSHVHRYAKLARCGCSRAHSEAVVLVTKLPAARVVSGVRTARSSVASVEVASAEPKGGPGRRGEEAQGDSRRCRDRSRPAPRTSTSSAVARVLTGRLAVRTANRARPRLQSPNELAPGRLPRAARNAGGDCARPRRECIAPRGNCTGEDAPRSMI